MIDDYLTSELISAYMQSDESKGRNRVLDAGQFLRRTGHPVTKTPEAVMNFFNWPPTPDVLELATKLAEASTDALGYYGLLFDHSSPRKIMLIAAATQYRQAQLDHIHDELEFLCLGTQHDIEEDPL